jgi:hypothetical protein
MSFTPPAPPARFKKGDRVAINGEEVVECGTILAVLQLTVAGAQYQVGWDNHPPGPAAEQMLIPCPTDTR